MSKTVVITDYGFSNIELEKSLIKKNGYRLVTGQCKTEEDVLKLTEYADAILVQWAPITRDVIENLKNCKVIVRYGIGVDNVDIRAAWDHKIPVCNVPDYCLDEVANHTMALALALGRQLLEIDKLVRSEIWKITPPLALLPFREMTFGTLGYGRIAQRVIDRARSFGFKPAANDPFVRDKDIKAGGVTPMCKEELFANADVISLHLPLNEDTHHMINRNILKAMKRSSILINTARGGLIDTDALVWALQNGEIAGVGLDVFEDEPLEKGHPLIQFKNVILTSHTAWYSSASVPELQLKAVQEVIRGLRDEKLINRLV